ncbi:MAG: 3-dehydro-L-gulonate 2-dehydrogenase [Bacteroidota bacterium]
MKIDAKILKETFLSILIRYGFTSETAETIARIYTETTIDGVFSHGINRFPRFINEVKEGTVAPAAVPKLVNGMNALEQWDGGLGAGITNAIQCADRSMELAREYGIGCLGLRNTNHWMRGGSYGWRVAQEGFLFMGWTNTLPNMPPWGGDKAALGNNPFVLAIPHRDGHIVLDMAMSQYSYGKLEWHQKCGTNLPEYGGFNRDNQLTKDPSEILETERILPIGLWKGSALSMVLDLAAAILSGGNTSKKIGEYPVETKLSQVFISIDIEKHLGKEQLNSLIGETVEFNSRQNESAQYPGQRSLKNRKYHMEHGMEIPNELWKEITHL